MREGSGFHLPQCNFFEPTKDFLSTSIADSQNGVCLKKQECLCFLTKKRAKAIQNNFKDDNGSIQFFQRCLTVLSKILSSTECSTLDSAHTFIGQILSCQLGTEFDLSQPDLLDNVVPYHTVCPYGLKSTMHINKSPLQSNYQ